MTKRNFAKEIYDVNFEVDTLQRLWCDSDADRQVPVALY